MQTSIPKKRFGQNFLINPGIIYAIVEAINPQPTDYMLEIGPGLGALTIPILERIKHLSAIEIDRDIVTRLTARFSPAQLTLYQADVLQFDFSDLASPMRIIGNLPYNISSPLLFHLIKFQHQIQDMHFMLQKEVVERMVAEPNTPDYGRLSVMLQYRFHLTKLLDVPATAFNPPPKVESAVVRLIPKQIIPEKVRNETLLSELVKRAFAQRRKTLSNNFKGLLTPADFNQLMIEPGLRPQALSVTEFIKIANYVDDHGLMSKRDKVAHD